MKNQNQYRTTTRNNKNNNKQSPSRYISELTKSKPQQNHFLTFSHQTHRPGKMIIFKVQGVRCTPKLYHLHLPA